MLDKAMTAGLADAVVGIIDGAIATAEDAAHIEAATRLGNRLLDLILAAEQGELPAVA